MSLLLEKILYLTPLRMYDRIPLLSKGGFLPEN